MAHALGQILMSMCLTACAKITVAVAGADRFNAAWHQHVGLLLFSFIKCSGEALMRLWPNTGWKLRWWIIALRCLHHQHCFPSRRDVRRSTEYMLLKKLADKLKFPHTGKLCCLFSEL